MLALTLLLLVAWRSDSSNQSLSFEHPIRQLHDFVQSNIPLHQFVSIAGHLVAESATKQSTQFNEPDREYSVLMTDKLRSLEDVMDQEESDDPTPQEIDDMLEKHFVDAWDFPHHAESRPWQDRNVGVDISMVQGGTSDVVVLVNNLQDNFSPSASYCLSLSFSTFQLCNIRSAWLACLSLNTSTSSTSKMTNACQIVLPTYASISLNQSYGQLEANQWSRPFSIQILGNKASIQSVGKIRTKPSFSRISNLPFVSPKLSNTKSATRNTATVSLTLCGGMSVNISTYPFTGDPILRLYDAQQNELTNADDQAGLGAIINYQIPSRYQGCNNVFQLKVGCYSNTNCTMTVMGNYSMDIKPRFLYFQQASTSSNNLPAYSQQLIISNISFRGFGYSSLNGGCLFLDGALNLTIQQSIFSRNVGNYGAAIFLSNNPNPVRLEDLQFLDKNAAVDGTLFIDKGNTQITSNNLLFNASITVRGINGAIWNPNSAIVANVGNVAQFNKISLRFSTGIYSLTILPTNVRISLDQISIFRSVGICVYSSLPVKVRNLVAIIPLGTGMTIYGDSKLTYEEMVVINNISIFYGVATGFYINSAYVNLTNIVCASLTCCVKADSNVNITNLITSNTCSDAISIRSMKALPIVLSNITVTNTSANSNCVGNRGIYLEVGDFSIVGQASAVFDLINIANCGAGMGVRISGFNFKMTNSIVQNCSQPRQLGQGSGIYIGNTNNVLLINVTIFNNSAAVDGGAGLFLENSQNFTLVACNVSSNIAAGSGGGGILLRKNNTNVLMIDSYTYSTAGYFTYSYTSTAIGYFFNKTYSVPGVTSYLLKVNQMDIGRFDLLMITINNDMVYFYMGFYGQIIQLNGGCDGGLYQFLCLPGLQVAPKVLTGKRITVQLYANEAQVYTTAKVVDLSLIPLYSTQTLAQKRTIPTSIEKNYASVGGGGINILTTLTSFTMVNVAVLSNKAFNSGGGILAQISNKFFTWIACNFTNNTAGTYGGGVYFQMGNAFGTIINSSFTNNNAGVNGGGMMMLSFNGAMAGAISAFNITNNVIINNTAVKNGGGVYFGDSNFVVFDHNIVQGNVASTENGGGWYIEQANQINATKNMYVNNSAYLCGGAVNLANQNLVIFTSNTFMKNNAILTGGAMCSQMYATVTFNKTQYFYQNKATFGGAIAIIKNYIWRMVPGSKLIIDGNVASRGSGLFVKGLIRTGLLASMSLLNITFQNNEATTGGTVFWVFDSSMTVEPPGSQSPSLRWVNNSAAYGVKLATQAVSFLVPPTYVASVYSNFWSPMIVLRMNDAYQQQVMVSNDTFVYPTLLTKLALASSAYQGKVSPPHCDSFNAFISGSNIVGVGFKNGMAVFDQLQGFCRPGGNFTIQFEAKLGDHLGFGSALFSDYNLINKTLIAFRECLEGEYEKNGECVQCPNGQFSLITPVDSCQDCSKMAGVDECYSDQIIVSQGYWRRRPGNTAVIKCLLGVTSCVGGNVTGNALCGPGYIGPLCSVCDEGYYLSDKECLSCEGKSAISPATIAILVVAPVLVMVVFIALYVRDRQLAAISVGTNAMPTIATQTFLDQWYTWWKARYADIMVRTKIIVSTYQIVTATATVFDVSMPEGFANFSNVFNFLNFGLTSIVPLGCVSDFNFMATLLWTTMLPLLLIVALLCMFVSEILWMRWQLAKISPTEATLTIVQLISPACNNTECIAIKQKYLNYFFYITYLILPSTTTTIFKTFICKNVDPYGEDQATYDYYLVADMNISCQSDYYHNWVIYAVMMVLLYPIGIPVMYFCMLYFNREEISKRNDPPEPIPTPTIETEAETEYTTQEAVVKKNPPEASPTPAIATSIPPAKKRTISPNVTAISFLFGSYTCRYWYWEIVETYRRIFLTAVVSVIEPGTPQQNVISILFASFFIRLYGSYQPYGNERSNILAEMGQVQIFFTFFMALLIQSDVLSDNWMSVGDVLLVWLNIGVMLVIIYFQYQVYVEKLQIPPLQRIRMTLNHISTACNKVNKVLASSFSRKGHTDAASNTNNPMHGRHGLKEEATVEEIEMGTIVSKSVYTNIDKQ